MPLGFLAIRAHSLNHGVKVVGLFTEADCVIEGPFEKVVVPVDSRPPFFVRVGAEHGRTVLGI
eukprot:9477832-Lingulodinium_polyedra.AAC.1